MTPVRGLVPGCPAATDWMTLLTWPWLCKVRALNDQVKGRAWVDDLTAWLEGPTETLSDFVHQALEVTNCMQTSLGLQLNLIKSGILVSHEDLKAAMTELPLGTCVAVKDCIKDLGVAQGRAREATQLGRLRWQASTARLGRTAKLTLPFGSRVKIAATSALTAATYGSAARPTPAGLLSNMRRWMMHAVWRGTTRVCAELLLHTGDVPWRGDPWALTLWKLCDFFGSLIRTGSIENATLAQFWDLAGPRGQGPLAALRKGLLMIGVTGPLDCWTLGASTAAPDTLIFPLTVAPCRLRGWLMRALLARDLELLCRRRPGIDWQRAEHCITDTATIRKSLGLTATQTCALRGVQAGDCFTQRQAKHWSGKQLDTGLCPFCQVCIEDEEHRWASCPAWSAARNKAMQGRDAAVLWRRLPKVTATYGLPTLPPVVDSWRKTLPLATALTAPTPNPAPRRVWLDGSGLHPKDRHIRVTAWALAWKDSTWHTLSGWTCPPHTVPRAELSALCVALSWEVTPLDVCTDCQLVSKGFAQILRAKSLPKALLQSPLGDLWLQVHNLLADRTGITVRWMPAHLNLGDLQGRGFTADDFHGNDLADRSAKNRAALIAPPPDVVAARTSHAADEKLAMRTIGCVQEAMLATRARITGTAAALKTRKRKAPQRLFNSKRAKPANTALPTQHQADILHLAWHRNRAGLTGDQRLALLWQLPPLSEAGVHRIMVPYGPAVRQGSIIKPRNGALNLTAFCTKCGRKATNTGRWILLGRTSCSDAPFRGLWVQHFHEFPDGPPRGHECTACGLTVTSAARAAAERRLCPIWHFEVNGISDRLATACGPISAHRGAGRLVVRPRLSARRPGGPISALRATGRGLASCRTRAGSCARSHGAGPALAACAGLLGSVTQPLEA